MEGTMNPMVPNQAELPRPLIEGPSAWIGAEMARKPETWIHPLSPGELAEIEAARSAVAA